MSFVDILFAFCKGVKQSAEPLINNFYLLFRTFVVKLKKEGLKGEKMLRDKIFKNPGFKLFPESVIRAGLCSWFFVAVFNMLIHKENVTSLAFVQGKTWSLIVTAVLFILFAVFVIATEYYFPSKKYPEYLLIGSYSLFAVLTLSEAGGVMTSISLAGIGAIIVVYVIRRGCFNLGVMDISGRAKIIITASVAVMFAFLIAFYGLTKHWVYGTPNFDFGIFCHMFHNMSESFIPYTTCERDGLLSHFAVHLSPICYLLLPIYWLFPYAETLQISQALILMSGVIPLLLIAKARGMSHKASGIIAVLYCAYPAITVGCVYDFHENCFLLPLLLWIFYFGEREKYIPLVVFTALALLVKEDAFIYIIIYGVYLLVARKRPRAGVLMCSGALAYFVIAYAILSKFGLGIMDNARFGNLIYGDGGLVGAIKTLIVNPSYAFSQLMTSKNAYEKLIYILELFGPLAFIPFVTKKMSRYILLTPILINLLSTYVYQCDLRFQYHFGITAFIFYITILNVGDMSSDIKKYFGAIACLSTVLLFMGLASTNMAPYVNEWRINGEVYDKMDDILEEHIPDDASVACTTYIVPHLYKRAEIYEVFYHKENGVYKTDVDYVVFLMRGNYAEQSMRESAAYLSAGYTEVYNDNMLWILKAPS